MGHYGAHLYEDAWHAAKTIIPRIPQLEEQTLLFVKSFLGSSYPEVVKEAALFNLSVLRSQTVFRLPSGHLMGWEGVRDRVGSCHGSCTHVWNYEVATPFLFGDLARTMRDVEFNYTLKEENGLMNFRAALPLSEAAKGSSAAADGQMGCIMKFYREWQLSGDNDFLRNNWEHVKKALSYAWVERGWDGNQDGVMEGSQHNTMDVNYFGPNPQMEFWYMGALRAAEEMAIAMKDKAFARGTVHGSHLRIGLFGRERPHPNHLAQYYEIQFHARLQPPLQQHAQLCVGKRRRSVDGSLAKGSAGSALPLFPRVDDRLRILRRCWHALRRHDRRRSEMYQSHSRQIRRFQT